MCTFFQNGIYPMKIFRVIIRILFIEQTVDEVLVILVGYNHGIPSRVRKPHRVPREARIRALVLLENGVHVPPPAQPRVVLPEFRGQTHPFPKHLIIPLLPVEKVPITPHGGTGGFWRVCDGADHGAKIGIFWNVEIKICSLSSMNRRTPK